MKRYLLMVLVVIGFLSVLGLNESEAKSSYGQDVDSYCLNSDPYGGNCMLCHDMNDTKLMMPPMTEYISGNLCYFCADDSNCTGPACVDGDGDGYFAEAGCGTFVDCNDDDASMNPAMAEICDDTKDNDCNGLIDIQDPDCKIITCTDSDGDGYSVEGGDCGPKDCNANNPDIYPSAIDICNDGIDQDCSGKDRTKGKGCKAERIRPEGKGKTCRDGVDNDNNGLIDCADYGCSGNRACIN